MVYVSYWYEESPRQWVWWMFLALILGLAHCFREVLDCNPVAGEKLEFSTVRVGSGIFGAIF